MDRHLIPTLLLFSLFFSCLGYIYGNLCVGVRGREEEEEEEEEEEGVACYAPDLLTRFIIISHHLTSGKMSVVMVIFLPAVKTIFMLNL